MNLYRTFKHIRGSRVALIDNVTYRSVRDVVPDLVLLTCVHFVAMSLALHTSILITHNQYSIRYSVRASKINNRSTSCSSLFSLSNSRYTFAALTTKQRRSQMYCKDQEHSLCMHSSQCILFKLLISS